MKAAILFVALTGFSAVALAQNGAIVFGKVRTSTGAALGGAWVSIVWDPVNPASPPPAQIPGTPARPDGSFSFVNLNAGTYHFCAKIPGSTWLDPCDWNATRISVTVKAGQVAQGVVIPMQRGTALPIRLNDPYQLLAQYQATKTPGAHVLVGVTTVNGGFRPAAKVSQDAGGQTHQIVVPADTQLKIVTTSGFFKLSDSQGNDVAAQGGWQFGQASSAAMSNQMNFTVTGLVKP